MCVHVHVHVCVFYVCVCVCVCVCMCVCVCVNTSLRKQFPHTVFKQTECVYGSKLSLVASLIGLFVSGLDCE